MKLLISEVSKRMNVSVRTLRYYDEIGLLKPGEVTDAGYRVYDRDELITLQQILFYRELEIPLKQIRAILSSPDNDRLDALRKHRRLLTLKRERIDEMIELVDETLKGESIMNCNTSGEVERAKREYAEEVRNRWGDSAEYKESVEKEKTRDEAAMLKDADDIFRAFSEIMDTPPDGEAAKALVERWKKHITDYYYNCTNEILACLGEMYVADERFTANIDKFADGTAKFMNEAIKAYCGR